MAAEPIKVEISKSNLIITCPLTIDKKTKKIVTVPSKSGKTLLVATTGGNKVTPLKIEGKNVTLGLNAYIYND